MQKKPEPEETCYEWVLKMALCGVGVCIMIVFLMAALLFLFYTEK